MGYSSGMLRDDVEILKKMQVSGKISKNSGATAFQSLGYIPSCVTFNRGIKAVREASLDGTDYVMVRMRYNDIVNRNSYLYYDGVMYMVTEFHRDYHDNIIQIKAVETTDKRVILAPDNNVESNTESNGNTDS